MSFQPRTPKNNFKNLTREIVVVLGGNFVPVLDLRTKGSLVGRGDGKNVSTVISGVVLSVVVGLLVIVVLFPDDC